MPWLRILRNFTRLLMAGICYGLQWPLALLARVVPAKNNLWLFSSWSGLAFNDNAAALYQYVCANEPEIDAYYLVKQSQLVNKLSDQGVDVIYAYSLWGLWLQLRARVVFFSHKHNREYVAAALWRRDVLLCQLWHGTPLKKIGLSDPERIGHDSRLSTRFAQIFLPWVDMPWHLMTASSSVIADIFKRDFFVDRVVATGYPRLDLASRRDISEKPERLSKIIYMPTFRGSIGTSDSHTAINSLMRASGFDVKKIDTFLLDHDMQLVIRLHPSNRLDNAFLKEIEAAKCISFEGLEVDFYASINEYDVLITDYSSVFFDFLVTGKPVIHAGFDVEEYLHSSREMYFEYSDVCLTPQVQDWEDILALIEFWCESGYGEQYTSAYSQLRRWSNNSASCSYSSLVVGEVRAALGSAAT